MLTYVGSMQSVESKYRGFPFAFTYPENRDKGSIQHLLEVNAWFKEHNLVFNRDYVNFDKLMRRQGLPGEAMFYCIAFKDRNTALLFKVAWA